MSELTADLSRWHLTTLAPWPAWALALAAVAAVLAVVAAGIGGRGLGVARRLALVVLRTLGVVTILAVLLQPALEVMKGIKLRGRVAVLLDASASMSLPHGLPAPSGVGEGIRFELALEALSESRPWLESVKERYRFEFYAFDERPHPRNLLTLLDLPPPVGETTNIFESLEEVARRKAGRPLSAAIIFSDGADTSLTAQGGTSPTGRMVEFPVHTFAAGGRERFQDLAVTAVSSVESIAFLGREVEIEAEVVAHGFPAGTALPVALRRRGQVVMTRDLSIEAGKEIYHASFKVTPRTVGTHAYEVSLAPLSGEALETNNRIGFLLQVIRDKVRLLQVCGRPSWDERFLRRAFKEDPAIDLISFFILRTPDDLQLVPQNELSLIPFPTNELFTRELTSFDIVIFQNFSYRPYHMHPYLRNVHDYVVNHGGAFVMLGGELSFDGGVYRGTPIESILPVSLGAAGLVGPSPEISRDNFLPGEYRPRLTEAGRRHPVTAVLSGAVGSEGLPPLSGLNPVGVRGDGATVLLEHPFLKVRGANAPLLSVAEAGKGRTMAVATDSLWHWGFPSYGQGGDGRLYLELWERAVRWLIRDPAFGRLKINSDSKGFPARRPNTITIHLLDKDYRPAGTTPVEVEVLRAGAEVVHRAEGKTDGQGRFSFGWRPESPGPHLIRATLKGRGGEGIHAEETVVVSGEEGEWREVSPRPELLEELSRATDGVFHQLPLKDFPDLPLPEPEALRVTGRETHPLWDTPLFLALACLFLGVEWALRRRWGRM